MNRGANQTDSRRTTLSAIALTGPLAVYLLLGLIEPRWWTSPQVTNLPAVAEQATGELATPRFTPSKTLAHPRSYALFVVAKLMIVGGCLVVFSRHYLVLFPWQIDRWAWIAGAIGAVIWIGCCAFNLEAAIVQSLGFDWNSISARSQLDPFAIFDSPQWTVVFLIARLGLLVVVVPLAEEAFLRGFLMRFVHNEQWLTVALAQIGWRGLICGTLYGVLTHPQEALAALVWFSVISVLMIRTGKFWNCVVAHAVTNALLGAYILLFRQWQLW